MTVKLADLSAAQVEAAKAEIADHLLPYVKTAARQRLGLIKYAVISPWLRELILNAINISVSLLAPQLSPFVLLLEQLLPLIDPQALTDEARAILEVMLGLIKHAHD